MPWMSNQKPLWMLGKLILGAAFDGFSTTASKRLPEVPTDRLQRSDFARLLRACSSSKDLSKGKRIHAQILASEYERDRYLANLLVQMYGKCGSPEDARRVFDGINPPNTFSWSIMMAAYTQNGRLEEAKSIFDRMLDRDVVSWTAMVAAFAQGGQVAEAKSTFDTMPERNVVSWNAMVAAYAQNGHLEEAKTMFERMPKQNVVSWNSMITSYAQGRHLDEVKRMFDKVPERDVISWNVILTAYAQNGLLEEANKMLQVMPERNIVCWTAMVAAYGQHCHLEEARGMFNNIPEKDVLASTAMLVAYAQNGHLMAAKSTFNEMPEHNVFTWNAMIAAYAQNGQVEEAMNTFISMPDRDVVSWNAILAVHAQNGHGKDAIELFRMMGLEGFKPDEVSYMSILTACSRIGMVDRGRCSFISMSSDHGLKPLKMHYCCMIDILGRAGRLDDAEELINNMPYIPDDVAWVSLIGACRIYRDVVRGARAAQHLIGLNPDQAGPYVLLGNVYAAAGRQEDVALVRKMMKDKDVKQNPGISTIEVQNVVHKFTVGDTSHPLNDEIRAELQRLSRMMEDAGYVPETKEVLHVVTERQKEELLCDHSEKLAMAFGLISTQQGSPLRVMKSLRVCLDCHTATKFISKIVGRKIIVRDSSRFHRFEHGTCSCGDYW